MEYIRQPVIPGLPDDLALRCLGKLSHGHYGLVETVSKTWRDLVRGSEFANYRRREGLCGNWLFVLTEGSDNEWFAYDPAADRWHPLAKAPSVHGEGRHYGFTCISVCGGFYVIGGSYSRDNPALPRERPLVTNEVLRFDPFRNEWTNVASMITPRSQFACCVVEGRIYVAGGRNLSCSRGIALAEVYDPVTDKWEELPPMPHPQMDCLGLSYKGKFHVLSDQVGLPDQNTSEVFSLSDGTWCTVEDVWPFSKAMQFAVQVIGDNQVYTVVDWGESLIKTRDTDKGEWYNIGSVPSVVLPNHCRQLEAFGYGFAALQHELYIIGGKALKWDQFGPGRFDIVKLDLVRVCNPLVKPLKWRETRPMIAPARGAVIGCASMEEEPAEDQGSSSDFEESLAQGHNTSQAKHPKMADYHRSTNLLLAPTSEPWRYSGSSPPSPDGLMEHDWLQLSINFTALLYHLSFVSISTLYTVIAAT